MRQQQAREVAIERGVSDPGGAGGGRDDCSVVDEQPVDAGGALLLGRSMGLIGPAGLPLAHEKRRSR